MKRFLLACAVLALAPACARTQKLIVRTYPEGAQVSIVKRGQLRTGGHVAGVVAVGTSETYEDPEISIGTSPLTYEFRVVEEQGGLYVPGFAARQDKVCREVAIRARLGDLYGEQVVLVSGDEAEIYLQLTAAPPPPPPPTAPMPPPGS